ncbi:CHAT domain-containing protein [Halorubrum vacuolatum]|uniref:Uncharacterized protein n=1 Tax=Halorubrum vacuolatum TaxID=63740 RepID=A0A238X3X7_HALVU|nr:caspase family protein [Halorubrum vacuolatum]SNR53637.1 hypothetical protein SAMN06264855_11343 [Halorubrum vacuolatum]
MSIEIEPLPVDDGITVTDHIEQTQFVIYTDRPVTPEPSDPDDHYFPVGTAVTVETGTIEIPRLAVVSSHTADGDMVTQGDDYTLPFGRYSIGIDPVPTKCYLTVEAAVTVTTTDRSTRLEFDDCRTVSLGFRSLHQVPAGTIGTPTDPESLMGAVSLFGSALQTLSPERSFPTLRGHPPLLEPAETFTVPEHVDSTTSGVQIVVPPEYRSIYPIVPLAYYFAADVVPGSSARIVGDGWEHSLEPDLERRAGELLRLSFHLDCITRTEGLYPVDLHERETTSLDLDWERLYEMPLAERLGEHVSIPFERVASELPRWTLTTDVRPHPENAEMLPFIAAELSLVRSPETVNRPTATEQSPAAGFLRSPDPATAGLLRGGTSTASNAGSNSVPAGAFTRGARGSRGVDESDRQPVGEPTGSEESIDVDAEITSIDPDETSGTFTGFIPDDADFVCPEPTDTVEHAWVGEGVPLGANKATLEAYHRRLKAGSVDQSRISVLVVCNDEQMREEGNVAELYGLRDMVQFDIEVRYDLTREEMETTLASDVDFLHYIGHVDERGMQCTDGYLDLRGTSVEVGVDAFLLNACQSYEQGEALIHRGSRGGIVTLTDVANSSATRLGRIIARLMNSGFNLRTALHVAQRELITGNQYIVVGDGGTTICQNRSGVALVFEAEQNADDDWNFSARAFPNGPYGVGTMTCMTAISMQNYYIPGKISFFDLPRSKINEIASLEMLPLFIDGQLVWTDEFISEDV